jgi:hypothetical protein
MSGKHSKTPWRVSKRHPSQVVDADGFVVLDAFGAHLSEEYDGDRDGHWSSAPGAHRDIDEDEEEANARLGAAAPEMAEALAAMLRAWDRHVGKRLVTVKGGPSATDRAEAALKKAGVLP